MLLRPSMGISVLFSWKNECEAHLSSLCQQIVYDLHHLVKVLFWYSIDKLVDFTSFL
jgi:hypothetical protein